MVKQTRYRVNGALSTLLLTALLSCISTGTLHAQNLIVNADFSAGNASFSSSYTYFMGSPLPEGRYVVDTSPRKHHPLQADFGDHTTGTGMMMIINGGTLSNVFDFPVWEETVNVEANTDYGFSYWTTTADSFDGSPARLAVSVNGQFIINNVAVPNPGGVWTQFSSSWSSGSGSTADIRIYDLNTNSSGNDFVLDDISFQKSSVVVPESSVLLLFVVAASITLGLGLCRFRRRLPLATQKTNLSVHYAND